jgi:acyl carrier protein
MVSETPARPVEADEVFRIIRERLADILEIEESRITLEASFAEDLSADSLALIELVEAIEQELEDRASGFRIEDEDLAELRTVRDAVDYVVERVG